MKSSESELFVLPTTDRSVGEAGEKKCLQMCDFGNREDIVGFQCSKVVNKLLKFLVYI